MLSRSNFSKFILTCGSTRSFVSPGHVYTELQEIAAKIYPCFPDVPFLLSNWLSVLLTMPGKSFTFASFISG